MIRIIPKQRILYVGSPEPPEKIEVIQLLTVDSLETAIRQTTRYLDIENRCLPFFSSFSETKELMRIDTSPKMDNGNDGWFLCFLFLYEKIGQIEELFCSHSFSFERSDTRLSFVKVVTSLNWVDHQT